MRPQEIFPALESFSILNVATLIALIGIGIDFGTGKLKRLGTPQLPFLGAFAAWCYISTTLNVGVSEAKDIQIKFPILFMLVVLYSATTFPRIRAMAALLLVLSMSLSAIGNREALNPYQCIRLNEESGEPLGIDCDNWRECQEKTHDEKHDFTCEKAGPFDTFTVTGGRVRYLGLLQDPNEMALAIAAGLTFAFAMHAAAKGATRHLFLLATVALATSCVIETQSRGGMLVVLTIFGTYFLQRYGLKGLVMALPLGAPVFLLGGRDGEEAESSALERLGALYDGMDFFRSKPIIGLGWGQFTENYFITAHNSYVLAAAELGFPGLVLWSLVLYSSIKIPYSIATSPPAGIDPRLIPYAFALTTTFAGMLVGIFFLSFSYHAILWIYFGLAGAFYLTVRHSVPRFEIKVRGKEIAYIVALDAMLMATIFVYTRIKGAP
jgi:hypothetical protein